MSPECLSEERVAELVEGRLAGAIMAEAQRHLASCPACRALVTSMADVAATGAGPSPPTATIVSPLATDDHVGRYLIERLLGAGAMGRVYAALDSSLDRRVALKLLRPDAAAPDLEARLLREAKAMARIAHPHVVGVYDVGRHGDEVYIAMELVEGGTLREWLSRAPRPWREVLDAFSRAGEGLAEAHAAGIIHRDFKPDNVLVGDDGKTVRVTDFGLARADTVDPAVLGEADTRPASDGTPFDSPLTQHGALIGTPLYMAPEQYGGAVLDARADVYAFCVALYEGLYGERPFGGTNLIGLHAAKVADRVQPAPRDALVPSRIRHVILSGLRADPRERPATMVALLSALRRAARPPRWRWAGALLAGAALAIVAIYGVEARTRAAARSAPGASSANVASAATCSNATCAREHGGAPWVCGVKAGVCVAVEDERCKAYFEPGDLEAGDTVWLGALLPSSGPLTHVGESSRRAVDLGRRELAQATRPFTGPGASLHVRRVAVVMCDDGAADGTLRSAEHLVDDVGVPAVLGFRSGQEVADVAGALLIGRGVVSVATLSSSALVTQIPQPADTPRMVWRTTVGMGDVANGVAAFVREYFEPHRSSGRGPTRIALLRTTAPGSIAFAQALLKSLAFNGKSAVDNGDAYQEIGLAPEGTADVAAAARRVTSAAPGFLIVNLGPSRSVSMIAAIEAGWPAATARPIYLLAFDPLEPLAGVIGTDGDLRRRVLGINSDSSSAANAHFVVRFNEANGDAPVSRTENPGSSYDAFYLLAYAAEAAPPGQVDGRAIVAAFARLAPGGRAIEVGPTGVFEGLSALARGETVDLEGASSSLDIVPRTGEVAVDFRLYCLGVDARGRATKDSVEAGLTYVARTRRVVGQLRCP